MRNPLPEDLLRGTIPRVLRVFARDLSEAISPAQTPIPVALPSEKTKASIFFPRPKGDLSPRQSGRAGRDGAGSVLEKDRDRDAGE